MKYKVYHAINPSFGFGIQPKFPEEYKLVAIVDCENIEDTFRVTNHIDEAWTKNPEVLEVIGNGHRSTSVGDVVVDENKCTSYCDSFGWKEIN